MPLGDFIGEFFGEVFIEIIYKVLFRPCLYHSGVAVHLFLNIFRKHKIDPHKKKYNTLAGFLLWVIILTITILLLLN